MKTLEVPQATQMTGLTRGGARASAGKFTDAAVVQLMLRCRKLQCVGEHWDCDYVLQAIDRRVKKLNRRLLSQCTRHKIG